MTKLEKYMRNTHHIPSGKPVLMWAEVNTAGNVVMICKYRHWFDVNRRNRLKRVSVFFDESRLVVTVTPHIYSKVVEV